MSDTFATDTEPDEGPNMARLRELAKRGEAADAAEARASAAERRIAILESGIDTTTPLGKFFTESFQGDLTDVEAVKTAATELGVPFVGQESVVEDTPEPNGTEDRQALAAESPADTGVEANPFTTATDQFNALVASGQTQENAMAGYIAALAGAAIAGDSRVIVGDNFR